MVIQMVTTLLYNKYLKYLISLYYKSMLNLIHLKNRYFLQLAGLQQCIIKKL